MKVSLNWIKEYTKLRVPITELIHALTYKSVEVETLTHYSELWKGIIVGEVIHLKSHGNANRLKIAKVDTGIKIFDIVCGAENIERGQKVAVALPGITLPNGVTIQKAIIRGVESEGMICATDELGLPKEDSMEIMILDHKIKPGTSLVKALLLDQEVLTIDVLPNRSDLLCHAGVAREIALLTESKYTQEIHKLPRKTRGQLPLRVTIQDDGACSRYAALVLDNVTIGESPHWMKNRLRSVGIRSINNIVDLTNYIMMDLGLPLHAFDYDRISGNTMTVRHSLPEETLVTLDGVKRELPVSTIVIQDAEKIIDLAGIMGGENSAITQATKRIILQSAVFNSKSIRETSRKLMHRTEAVQRFERGVNAQATLEALAKAYDLLKEMQDEIVLDRVIDIQSKVQDSPSIRFQFDRYEKLIGESVESKQALHIFEKLGCRIEQKEPTFLVVTPPAWRTDLHFEEDLIEEIARVIGYDAIGEKLPEVQLKLWPIPKQVHRKTKAKNVFKALGFQEVTNFSFISKKLIKNLGETLETHIPIENPMSADQAFLRTELLSSLLKNIADNQHQVREDLRFFEIAKVYHKEKEEEYKFVEKLRLAGVVMEKNMDFSAFKGIIHALLGRLGLTQLEYQIGERNFTAPGSCAQIIAQHYIIGMFGKFQEQVQYAFDIDQEIWWFDIDAEMIINAETEVETFQEIEKFPAVLYDLSIIVDAALAWNTIETTLKKESETLLTRVELFDIYEGPQIPANKKSLAFHLVYQSNDRTLTQKEIEPIHQQLIEALQRNFNASVRSL